MEIRGLTIPYSKNKASKMRKTEDELEKRLELLNGKFDQGEDTTESERKEYEHLKTELRHIYEKRAEGAIFRSKVRWIQEGEKPTKYFFNMERKNFNRKIISELTVADGGLTVNENQIMDEIKLFYENLYNSSNNSTNEDFHEFTNNINQQLPKLSTEQCNGIEGKLTLNECWEALKSMGTGRSPREDGFTAEFYKCFFEIVGKDLLNSYNAAYENGEMSVSQRRGIITLIPKENSDLRELTNWRPITLLNVDYKIASKAIATRMVKFLPHVINSNQTGFMKGRYIGQNIRLFNDIMEQTELQDIPGILLLLDFRKAFDTIEWNFIQQSLSLFNFGPCLKQWVKTFYTNSESAVLHNGFTTDFFKLSRGVRQGCPLSPYLFIVGVEILASRIRTDNNVMGIKIFGTEHKISQFADDTTLLLSNLTSVQNSLTLVDQFGSISGLLLNVEKTKALWLGPWRFKNSKPFGLKWTKDPVRALGTYISYNEKENNKKNIDRKIDNMKAKLDIWRARSLSLLGKCLIVKCLGISHLIYTASMLTIPNTYIPTIKSAIFSFIWNNKQDKIKRDVMYQDYSKGGLRAPNIETLFKSLNLAWISRLLTVDTHSSETWKSIPNHFFDKFGGLSFLLLCNYDNKLLESSELPLFYRQILSNFLELKTLYRSNHLSDLLLFNNKEIKVDGNSIQ